MKLKKFKLYYKKPKRDALDADTVIIEKTLFNADKQVLLYSTCLSVLGRVTDQSYKLKGIIYIDDSVYQAIRKEINQIDQKPDKDYITLYRHEGQVVFRLRSKKFEEEDMKLIQEQEALRMRQTL